MGLIEGYANSYFANGLEPRGQDGIGNEPSWLLSQPFSSAKRGQSTDTRTSRQGLCRKGLSEDLKVKVGAGQAAAYLVNDAALDGTRCPR